MLDDDDMLSMASLGELEVGTDATGEGNSFVGEIVRVRVLLV
jgi:hypothetical protein